MHLTYHHLETKMAIVTIVANTYTSVEIKLGAL
jgi:hypothetical protein